MKAVITGATGLVGGNLAMELLRRDVEVVCTRRHTSKADHLGALPITWVSAELGDPDALARAFAHADVVFHCAAMVSTLRKPTPELVAANVQGTRHVIHAVRRAGVPRLVHCSSTVARAISTTGAPVTESAAWNFDQRGMADGYAQTKHESEELVVEAARSDVDAVVVNPAYMFGPHDVRPSSGALIINVVKGKVPGFTEGYNNFVDVRDVCRGMIAAWQKGRRGESYILGNANMSYREVMELIARVAGVMPPRRKVPRLAATALGWMGEAVQTATGREMFINITRVRYGFCKDFVFSSGKAERELDYRPGPLETAVRDAIDWFRGRGML